MSAPGAFDYEQILSELIGKALHLEILRHEQYCIYIQPRFATVFQGFLAAMGTTGASCMEAPLTTMPGYAELERIVRADLHLMDLLCTAREINLPQCRVVAGCIYQSVWNVLTGRPRGTGINDYDLIYFDASDISEGAEKAIEGSVQRRLPAFPARIEVRNQARVLLWFEGYFGIPYPALRSVDEAITRYASSTHAVGIRLLQDDQLEVFAPFGLEDIFAMVIRPNYALPNRETHERKAARAKSVWPEVTIVPWS